MVKGSSLRLNMDVKDSFTATKEAFTSWTQLNLTSFTLVFLSTTKFSLAPFQLTKKGAIIGKGK